VQSFIKRYFFTVNFLFIAVAAYLGARAVNQFIGYFLAPPVPAAAAQTEKQQRPKVEPVEIRNFAEANERNVFAAKRETVVEADAESQPGAAIDLDADPVQSSLRAKLINTTVFNKPEWSLATIVDLGSQSTSMYSINECPVGSQQRPKPTPSEDDEKQPVVLRSDPPPIPCNRLLDQARIIEIDVTRVVVINESSNRKEYLELGAEPSGVAPAVAAVSAGDSGEPKGPTGDGIKKINNNSYEVAQNEIDATLANLNSIATQARIVPNFQDGKANGFKLFSIRPGSLYSKIGIQNGDVVTRINGYDLSSPDKALEIYNKLKDSKQVTVDVIRRGKPETIDYRIVP
jgi:general secretion pathway protein C